MTPIAFDIETTGLAADDMVISWATSTGFGYTQTPTINEIQLLDFLASWVKYRIKKDILVTFNGSNYKYGFDFPTLRTRFIKYGIQWPFKGLMHIDLFPIIEKCWNTSVMPDPSLERLRKKEQLVEVAKYLGIDDVNPKATLKDISASLCELRSTPEITEAIIATQDLKPVPTNKLKDAYQIITGKDPGDMDGKECVHLWEQYKASGDESILQRIREYNLEDCRKTLELYEICREYCSERDMKPEVL